MIIFSFCHARFNLPLFYQTEVKSWFFVSYNNVNSLDSPKVIEEGYSKLRVDKVRYAEPVTRWIWNRIHWTCVRKLSTQLNLGKAQSPKLPSDSVSAKAACKNFWPKNAMRDISIPVNKRPKGGCATLLPPDAALAYGCTSGLVREAVRTCPSSPA